MAQQTAFTTAEVPGSLAVTGVPADSNSHQSANGRCPRCERMLTEPACPGVLGEVIHLGN